MAQEKEIEIEEIQEIVKEFSNKWLKIHTINLPTYFTHTLISQSITTIPIGKRVQRIIVVENELVRFKSVLLLEKVSNEKNIIYFGINFDGETFILYKTKDSLQTYLIPYPFHIRLNELLNNLEVVKIKSSNTLEETSKIIFGIPEIEDTVIQGNLHCFKLKQPNRFTDFISKFNILKKEYSSNPDYYYFYNHIIPKSSWLSKTYFSNFRFLFSNEQIEIHHPAHPTVTLQAGIYLLYHPVPSSEEAD